MKLPARQPYGADRHGDAMASFPSLDRRWSSAVNALHDHLWVTPSKDEAGLLRRLGACASELDRHLGTKGLIAGGVRPVLRDFKKYPGGKDVFEFLHSTTNLAAGVAYRTKRPREAAKRASEVVSSLAIGLSSASDSFHLVDAFQSGKSDFMDFTTRLADVLENRGFALAGEFKRGANATYNVHAIWDDSWSKDFQALAVLDGIGSAAHVCALHVEALRVLGGYHEAPYGRLAPAVRRIVERIGTHA